MVADKAIAEPRVEASFELTRPELIRFFSLAMRSSYIGLAGYGAAVGLFGLLIRDLFIALVGLCVAGAGPGLLELRIRRRVDKAFTYMRASRITVDEHRLTWATPLVVSTYDWDMFDLARRRGGFWMLRARSGAHLPIPLRAFGPEQAAHFEDLLRGHGLPPRH
jgi:hypothetical protein